MLFKDISKIVLSTLKVSKVPLNPHQKPWPYEFPDANEAANKTGSIVLKFQ